MKLSPLVVLWAVALHPNIVFNWSGASGEADLSPRTIAHSSSEATFFGEVTTIFEGDTIEVLHNQRPERIRLHGIDCPEKGQAFGHKAKEAMSALVVGKTVAIQARGTDEYGRTIADVLLPDGTNVNQHLVKEGWCWWYRRYAPANEQLERLEAEARIGKKGLWEDPDAESPWEWREHQTSEGVPWGLR